MRHFENEQKNHILDLRGRQTHYLVKMLPGCVEFGKFISTIEVSDNKKAAGFSLVGARWWGTCHPQVTFGLMLKCQCGTSGSVGGFAA